MAAAWASDTRSDAQLSPRAHDFLAASQRQGRRARLRTVAVLAVLGLLVTGGGLTALVQWQRAVDREKATEQARRSAIAEGLLARADGVRQTDPRTALRLAVAADTIATSPGARANLLDTLVGSSPLAATITRHKSTVNTVAFTGSGTTLATGSADGTVSLWDVSHPDSPRPFGHPLAGLTGGVLAVAFTPDGDVLATATTGSSGSAHTSGTGVEATDAEIILWDTSDPAAPRRLGQPLRGHTGNIRAVAFTADGKTLVSGSTDGTVILWDASDPIAPRPFGTPIHDTFNVLSMAVTSDGNTLAVGGDSGVHLWDIRDPTAPRRLEGSTEGDGPFGEANGEVLDQPMEQIRGVNAVAFTPGGTTLVSGSSDGTFALWDVHDPATARRIGQPVVTHTTNLLALAFNRDGSALAIGSNDSTVTVWDVTDPVDPKRTETFTGHTDGVDAVAFAPNGATLATGSFDATAALWHIKDLAAPRRLPAALLTPVDPEPDYIQGFDPFRNQDVAVTADGTTLVRAAGLDETSTAATDPKEHDGPVEIWDITHAGSPRRVATLPGVPGGSFVRSTRFAPGGKLLVVSATKISVTRDAYDGLAESYSAADQNEPVELWDIADPTSPRFLAKLPIVADYSTAPSFTADAKMLAIGTAQGTLELWNLADPSEPRRLRTPKTDLDSYGAEMIWSPDGTKLIMTGYVHGKLTLEIWDTSRPESPRLLASVPTESIELPTFAPDGKTLASATYDGATGSTVTLWDLSDPTSPRRLGGTLSGHLGSARSLAFSHDSTTLAVGGETISLWDVADLASPRRIDLPTLAVESCCLSQIAFNADDTELTVANINGSALPQPIRWDLSYLAGLRKALVPTACARAGGGLTSTEWVQYIPDLTYQRTC